MVRHPAALILVLLVLALLVQGCVTPGAVRAPSAAQSLREAVEVWFDEDLKLHPLRATYLGDHRYDDVFGNPAAPESEQQAKASWLKAQAVVKAIDPDALSAQDRLTREVFLYNAEQAIAGFRFPERLLPLNQMDSPLLDFAKFASGEGPQPFETVAQHQAWLRRARGFPLWVSAAVAAMREGQSAGITQPQVVMKQVLTQVDALVKGPLEQSLFWKPLEKLCPQERAQLEPEYREVMGAQVMPALVQLRNFLRDEHLPRCRTRDGWSALPEGAAWYAWRVKVATTTELSPEQIHELGKKEVQRTLLEMEQVRKRMGFQGTQEAFFTWARTHPEFYFQRPEDLLQGFRALKQRIDAALPALFSVFPKAQYEVRPVEAFRAESAAGAEYQEPSADGKRPGVFYVNTFNLKAQPKYGMQTLSLHEAAPGHHFQIALQQELDLPRFRRFGGYVAFDEGWALYAETLGPALGLFESPMDLYGHLADGQLRAMRLVVDTGLHALGWTREQAIDFMLKNSSMARSDVVAEVERYMVWPGQALGYKVGQLRLLALRARAEAELGPAFDVKAFHAAVLTDGSLPLAVLEEKLGQFVTEPSRQHGGRSTSAAP